MKLIVGLGNPEEKHKNNRHNAGQMLVDFLKSRRQINADRGLIRAEKTGVYMNESGEAVKKLTGYYKVDTENLYVAYDDLDIPLGSYKISKGKAPRVHNGINSVVESLGREDFWHIRIGVDSRGGDRNTSGKDYVLQDFTGEEKKILEEVIKEIIEELDGRL